MSEQQKNEPVDAVLPLEPGQVMAWEKYQQLLEQHRAKQK